MSVGELPRPQRARRMGRRLRRAERRGDRPVTDPAADDRRDAPAACRRRRDQACGPRGRGTRSSSAATSALRHAAPGGGAAGRERSEIVRRSFRPPAAASRPPSPLRSATPLGSVAVQAASMPSASLSPLIPRRFVEDARDIGREGAQRPRGGSRSPRARHRPISAFTSSVRVDMPTGKARRSRSSGQPAREQPRRARPLQPETDLPVRDVDEAVEDAAERLLQFAHQAARVFLGDQQPFVGPEPQRGARARAAPNSAASSAARRRTPAPTGPTTSAPPRRLNRVAKGSGWTLTCGVAGRARPSRTERRTALRRQGASPSLS